MSIKIENTQVFGWEAAIRGARNPMNSWEKSDSSFGTYEIEWDISTPGFGCGIGPEEDRIDIGPNDHKLLMNLCKGGTEEAKWRRMVHVQMDVTAPLYWWKEFETYKVGTVSNSCSTMHTIANREFSREDFSVEHLYSDELLFFDEIIERLNAARQLYLDCDKKNKTDWWQMIQLLPSSYNQKRTIDLNYEVLVSMYKDRRHHKLDEWQDFCDWIETLPLAEGVIFER